MDVVKETNSAPMKLGDYFRFTTFHIVFIVLNVFIIALNTYLAITGNRNLFALNALPLNLFAISLFVVSAWINAKGHRVLRDSETEES